MFVVSAVTCLNTTRAEKRLSRVGSHAHFRTPIVHQQHRRRITGTRGLGSWVQSLFDQDSMGSSTSQGQCGWQPSVGVGERKYSAAGYDITPLTAEQREAAADGLNRLQRNVTLNAGTEQASTGVTANGYPYSIKEDGVYTCALGGLPLFDSTTKYESGTGWPSFWAPIDPAHVMEVKDSSIPFMTRVEVLCARSGAHLGHVFHDGPQPTGKRYCMNAAALNFVPRAEFDKLDKRKV